MIENKCPKCSTEFTPGVKFCKKCGCNLTAEFIETPTCPVCGKTFPTGTKFCNKDGIKLVSPEQLIPRCNKCGKQYTDGKKFCPVCGGSVTIAANDAVIHSADISPKRGSVKNVARQNKLKQLVKRVLKTIIILGSIVVLAVVAFFVLDRLNETLIPVSNNGETWGFISSRSGDFVINPQFEDADFFSNGLARVRSRGRTGYINKRGEFVIPATFRSGTTFNDGLAFVVSDGGHPTAINTGGEVQFVLYDVERVFAFRNGLALFRTEESKYGFVDTFGNVIINAQFEGASWFSGDFARVLQGVYIGFIDRTGNIVINPQFRGAGDFSEGKANVFDGSQWGYINTSGAFVINPQFDNAGDFNNGLAVIRQGEMWGYINRNGRMAINPQFNSVRSFSNRLAAVQISSGNWGFINSSGDFVINPQFQSAGDFFGSIPLLRRIANVRSIAPVQNSGNGRWGFINSSGDFVINPQFMNVKFAAEGVRNNFVDSDFYDTSEFISLFFEREDGNTFDGVNASTTLERLSSHPDYGAGLNARSEHFADFQNWIQITNDISVGNINFHFCTTPIFSWVNTYNSWGRVTNRRQQFDFTATPTAIVYQFGLGGRAHNKHGAVISALKDEIEYRQGESMIIIEPGAMYYLPQSDGRLGFIIHSNPDWLNSLGWLPVVLYVILDSEFLSKPFS